MRIAIMSLVFASLVHCHVPSFGCSCCNISHSPDVSQTFYFKTTQSDAIVVPMDKIQDSLHLSAVFQQKYAPDLLKLRIGCGKCEQFDLLEEVPLVYKAAELETFTQSAYYSGFERTYNSSELSQLGCSSALVVQLGTLQTNSTYRWSAVVGKTKIFTALELVSFPIYIARIHGSYWNQSYYYWVYFIAAIAIVTILLIVHRRGERTSVQIFTAYGIGLFAASGADKMQHLISSTLLIAAPSTSSLSMGFGVFIVIAEGIPIVMLLLLAGNHRRAPFCVGVSSLLSAVAFLFMFGSGYYAGILFLVAAAALSIANLEFLCTEREKTAVDTILAQDFL